MRISDWSSDVCSSDLGRVPDADDDRVPDTAFAHQPRHRFVDAPFLAAIGAAIAKQVLAVVHVENVIRRAVRIIIGGQPDRHRARIDLVRWEGGDLHQRRSEAHPSELQSLMRTSYAVFCLKQKTT